MREQFNDMYDGKVGRVHVCYDTRELDKLVAEFTSDSTKLQDMLDDYISKDRRRRRVRRQKVGDATFRAWQKHWVVPVVASGNPGIGRETAARIGKAADIWPSMCSGGLLDELEGAGCPGRTMPNPYLLNPKTKMPRALQLRRGSLLQITIVGPQYGQWGVQKFAGGGPLNPRI